MRHVSGFDPAVVIHVGRVALQLSVAENARLENRQRSGFLSGQKSGADRAPVALPAAARPRACPVVDPFRVRAGFPDAWARYIRANFRSVAAVVAAFDVSERTARKWWDGETGAHGAHVAVACKMHPETAAAMLFDSDDGGFDA